MTQNNKKPDVEISLGPDETDDVELLQIKKENLTGRQLRIARKLAQRHGLDAVSDLDAIRQLRHAGIDPFKQASVMGIGKPTDGQPNPDDKTTVGKIDPAKVPASQAKHNVPSPHVKNSEAAEREPISSQRRELAVRKIQQDLVRRRRRKLMRLVARVTFFVTLPTLFAGYYFYSAATPMYASYSEFSVSKAQSPLASATGGLFSASPFATQKEAVQVQGFLTSRDAMARLDGTENIRKVWSDDSIDVLQRLKEDASNEDMFGMYSKRVKIGFDPTDGIIKMEVIAPTPDAALRFSTRLLAFAEDRVDQLSSRARNDQMSGASKSFDSAEAKLIEANDRILNLQKKRGVLSAELEITSQFTQITTLESELLARQSALIELNSNARPNKAKVTVQENRIASLQAQIEQLRSGLTADTEKSKSLAEVSGELLAAQSQLLVRQQMMTQALTLLESARIEANRQTIYLTESVAPVLPDEAAYPKSFENTMLSALVFAGMYLMISLTASILREQVTT